MEKKKEGKKRMSFKFTIWYCFFPDNKNRREVLDSGFSMGVFYLISLPMTLGMVVITLKYFAAPHVRLYVFFTVGYAWFCSLSIIFIVPADIWTVFYSIFLHSFIHPSPHPLFKLYSCECEIWVLLSHWYIFSSHKSYGEINIFLKGFV